jgi:hypothetical protein
MRTCRSFSGRAGCAAPVAGCAGAASGGLTAGAPSSARPLAARSASPTIDAIARIRSISLISKPSFRTIRPVFRQYDLSPSPADGFSTGGRRTG